MRAAVEGVAALAMAVALHLGALAWSPARVGALASGDGGAAMASLEAADAVLAAMVAEWDRPPPMAAMPPAVTMPAQMLAAGVAPAAPAQPPQLAPAFAVAPGPPLSVALADMPTLAPPPLALPAPAPPPAPAPAPVLAAPLPAPAPEPVAQPAARPPRQPEARPKAKAAPVAKPGPAAAARAAQRAAGSGGGAQAGAGGAAQATLSKARVSDLRAGWGAAVKARVERRKSYPAAARGATGSATVRLTVAASGALLDVSLAASSGDAVLDQAAVRAVQAAAPFPAAPQGVPPGNQVFTLRLRFQR